MKKFVRVLTLCFIILLIIACCLSAMENIELNNELNVVKQEMLYSQKEIDTLNDNLQSELDKNKNMKKIINTLNLELSIANEKIENMQSTGFHTYFTEEEVNYIAKTVYGEARGCTKIQQSAVVWCILNRLDNGYWGGTIKSVVIARGQFHGYSSSHPVTEEIKELVEDVLLRWNMEKRGATNIGRTLPDRFLYFHSDGTGFYNYFTTSAGSGEIWTFDCWNPYE